MEIEYKQPKLKDKIYGEMFWEDWDEDEAFWYAPMTDAKTGERYDLLIGAVSPVDFLAVSATHSTFGKLSERLDAIRDEMMAEILEKSRRLFKKQRQRASFGEAVKKSLRLYSIKIFQDLSATVEFVPVVPEDEDPPEKFYALLDADGDLIEAGIEEL